jgi:beta-lactam-binding protein with PASTA domain
MKAIHASFLTRVIAALALLACALTAQAAATVTGLNLVSSTRIDRVTFSYTYTVNVQNGTPALRNATATVTSNVASITVTKGTVNLGTLAANAKSTSSDTFSIRVNRTVAVNASALAFVVAGTPLANVPSVVGLAQATAATTLANAGLSVGTVTQQSSGTVPQGNVISQNPAANTVVDAGSPVDLVVSSGPGQVNVPAVSGLTQAQAATALTSVGLVVGNVTQQSSSSVPIGNVISQNPLASTAVNPGSAVDLVVSSGVQVPGVVGLTQAQAATALTSVGLVVGTVTQQASNTVPSGSVISQNPGAGTQVNGGTAVNLMVSSGAGAATPASLLIELSQNVVGAGDPLTFTATAFDSGGNPLSPAPAMSFQVIANRSVGSAPVVSGNNVVTQASTRGSFQLQGSVNGTTVTASIGFTVLQNATQSGNAALYTTQSLAQANVVKAITAIEAAVNSGNTGAIAPAVAAMNAAAATVNPELTHFGTAYEPDVGFIPPASQLAGAGFPPTQADANFGVLVGNLRTKIQQITNLLNTPTGNDAADTATLQQLAGDLAALQAQVVAAANTPTPYGLSNNALAVDKLLGEDMPKLLRAIANRVTLQLQAAGLASLKRDPATFYASIYRGGFMQRFGAGPQAMYGSEQPAFLLTGLLSFGGGIGDLIIRVYGPFLDQLQKMALLLAAQGLLNSTINNFPGVAGLVTGASQSFHVYHAAGSIIYMGANLTQSQVNSAEVYLVGGAAVDALDTAANSIGGVTGVNSISKLFEFLKSLYDAIQGLGAAAADAHQQPDSIVFTSFDSAGCLLSSADPCYELNYDNGFKYVGSGGPIALEPVIVLVRIPDPTSPGYGSAIFNFVGR